MFVGIKLHDVRHEVFLALIYEVVPFAVTFSLQGHAELKLLIVDDADTRRPDFRLRHCISRKLYHRT